MNILFDSAPYFLPSPKFVYKSPCLRQRKDAGGNNSYSCFQYGHGSEVCGLSTKAFRTLVDISQEYHLSPDQLLERIYDTLRNTDC